MTTPSRSKALALAVVIVSVVAHVLGHARPAEAQQGEVFSSGSQPTLKGNVQQNGGLSVNSLGVNNLNSDIRVQQIALDMYHQLSVMWGNRSASQAAQNAFQEDVRQFGTFVSAGSTVASKLVPCVTKYQQAYPHVVLQSQYYNQNNSSAFNSEAVIANPLIKAGASCVSTATADQFASNGGNTYRGTPSPQVPTQVYPYPYPGTPPAPTAPQPHVNPSPCVPPDNLSPEERGRWYQTYILSGRIRCAGGYDPCANPDAPSWCAGNVPKPSNAQPPNNGLQPCQTPDWVHQYKAQGASPPIRYQVGFNQSVSRCLQNQCTVQNLALAVWAAAFPQVRAMLGIAQGAGFISAVVHPPGFSPDPDAYVRGQQEGQRLCNWVLQLLMPARARGGPIVGRNGKINIPRNFNAREAMNTIANWLPQINPSGCKQNCVLTAVNTARVLFGQPLEAAASTTQMGTMGEIEAAIGAKFSNAPLQDVALYQTLNQTPDGTVAIIAARNIYGNPGHTFVALKNGTGPTSLEFWDGQTGVETQRLDGGYVYEYMIIGNSLQP
jgi:Papain fold toxin 1, glutamine deamidase